MGFLDDFKKELDMWASINAGKNREGEVDPFKAAMFAHSLGYDSVEEQKSLWKRMAMLGVFHKKRRRCESTKDYLDNNEILFMKGLVSPGNRRYRFLRIESAILAIVLFICCLTKNETGIIPAIILGAFTFFVFPWLATRIPLIALVALIVFSGFWAIMVCCLFSLFAPFVALLLPLPVFIGSLFVHKVLWT